MSDGHKERLEREALLAHAKGRAGEVFHIEVRHDDWCEIFHNRACNCDPEIESGSRVDRKYGGPEQ